LWNFGPNFAADAVVISLNLATDGLRKVLLIRRSDSGRWALPGGFRDIVAAPDFAIDTPLDAHLEPADLAAARELREETGIILPAETALSLGHIVCDDPRATRNAWVETDGFLWQVPEPLPATAADDAAGAQWFNLDTLPDGMMTHHRALIEKAREHPTPMERLGKNFGITETNVHEIMGKMGD
jgi:ADP-ribose pyrophosphatase YjhB (NUDIX family)